MSRYNTGLEFQRQTTNADLLRQSQSDAFNRELAGVNAARSAMIDPFAVTNAQSNAFGLAGNVMAQGQAIQGPSLFSMIDPTIASMYGANANAANAGSISAGNNAAALWGSAANGLSSFAGQYMQYKGGGKGGG
jgi:hypothetical protein